MLCCTLVKFVVIPMSMGTAIAKIANAQASKEVNILIATFSRDLSSKRDFPHLQH